MRAETIAAHIEHVLANNQGKQSVLISAKLLREAVRELREQHDRGFLAGLRRALRISERKLPRHSRDMLNEIARRSFHDNARSYCIGAAETQEAIIQLMQDLISDTTIQQREKNHGGKLENRMDASHV
jgi:hypothetical protein